MKSIHEADSIRACRDLWSARADELRIKCDEQYAVIKEMCECLREAVEVYREVCAFHHFCECDKCNSDCPAKKWSTALAKAAGEEAKCEG